MATLSLLSFLLAVAPGPSQGSVPTVPSIFVAAGNNVYVPSPTYAVKSASADEQFRWSPDGTRLAYVTDTLTDSPRVVDRQLARGERPGGVHRLGVWSRDTGRPRDLFVGNEKMGIDKFVFLGRDLVFSTSETTPEGSRTRFWLARDGNPAQPLDIAGIEGTIKFLPARRRQALLAVGSSRMWLLDATRTVEIKTPGYSAFIGRGVTRDDQAVVMTFDANKETIWLLVNLATGTYRAVAQEPATTESPQTRPFILDAYAGAGKKASLFDDDPDAAKVDDRKIRISGEDGGYQVDLVERTGNPRRRIPFINDTSAEVRVSDDGLAFAFVSNRTLMVRWLVKLDAEGRKRLVGKG
jgi:Tol biopolymer transport system component